LAGARRDLGRRRAAFLRAGADHMTLGIPGRAGPEGLAVMASEVAEPVREAFGRA